MLGENFFSYLTGVYSILNASIYKFLWPDFGYDWDSKSSSGSELRYLGLTLLPPFKAALTPAALYLSPEILSKVTYPPPDPGITIYKFSNSD